MTTCRRITHLLPGVGALILLLAAFALPTYGQTNKGTIKGTVTDQNGGIVQNATVVVTNVGTNAERTLTTSDEGTYEAPLLDPGNYKVSVSAPTFSTATQENVVVQTSSTQVVDITLTVGDVGGTVTVTAAPALVESETSERGGVVTGREVTELPLSGRNFTLLATLTPGVARASNAGFGGAGPDARQFNNGDPRAGSGGPNASNAQGDTPTARFARSGAGTLTVNGQRPTNNNFSLDGVDNNEPQFGTIGVFPNPDAIAEFKVTTSVPPAEVGRAAGAVINTTTKSGTNEFHGSLYYYGQNSALNAFHPILKRDRAQAISRGDTFVPDKAVQQIHEYGGTLGGPIIKNKTFFFFDYLGQRNNIPFPFTSTAPTALSRIGNFTEFAGCNG
ncbi:MAG TPA: carboxypeptidase-like regulatory domain-containing protein, partial [Pyrinomonadaceae bacterium]|nr:carboxypeptidase-like regulatory domain-containing protein [Pyrinomonadaceae bacterium]